MYMTEVVSGYITEPSQGVPTSAISSAKVASVLCELCPLRPLCDSPIHLFSVLSDNNFSRAYTQVFI